MNKTKHNNTVFPSETTTCTIQQQQLLGPSDRAWKHPLNVRTLTDAKLFNMEEV